MRCETCASVLAVAEAVAQIEKRERYVLRRARERERCGNAHLVGRAFDGHLCRQPSERAQPALGDDPLRRLVDDAEHAADPAAIVAERTVREREVALLEVAVAVERKASVVERDSLACHHSTKHRSHDVPDLGEALGGAAPHRMRILRSTEDRSVGVVVEEDELRSPEHTHREVRGEHDSDGRAQRRGPAADGAERVLAPVDRAQERACLTAAVEASVSGLCRDRRQACVR